MARQQTELTEEQMRAIDNYGQRIKTLKDFVTSVRKRVTMYLGAIGNLGAINAMREIFQNSLDTILDKLSPGSWVSIHYDMITKECIVEDNGLGLPPDDILRILTNQHTSKNFEKKPYEYSSGFNGVGAKLVNAVSDYYIVESYKYDGTAVKMEFEKGYPKYQTPKSIPNKDHKQGLRTTYRLDESIMGEISLDWKTPYNLFKRMISTMPLGTTCYFSAVDLEGKEFKETIVNKDGIITDLIMKTKDPMIKPIIIQEDDGWHKLECAFCYDTYDSVDELSSEANVTSFTNMCPTIAGTHVDGVIEGITKWFSNYMNNIYLSNQKAKDKLKVMPADVKYGLNIMISSYHLDPQFHDQEKRILGNADMAPFCRDVIIKGLNEWSKSNPSDLAKLSKFFKDMAELRVKQDKDKVKIVQKYSSSSATGGLPRKYKRPTGKEHIELILVEGDSALGNVEKGRDKVHQGVMPLRGKIINAFNCSKQTFFNNEEVQAITKIILGGEYKRNFTIEECKVEKIIIMADADSDGGHIASLLERMFIMYFPQIIEAGMLYKALPPLYSAKINGKEKYFTEQVDIVRYIQKVFVQNYEMATLKKEVLNSRMITVFFMKNADYIYHLEKMANTYALDPNLLEVILYNYVINKNKLNFDKLRSEIKARYRFMDVYKEKQSIIVRGVIAKSNVAILTDKFFNDCKSVLDILNANEELYYFINKEKKTLYEIMKLYKSATPSGIKRYKGLGELSAEKLAESTLLATGNRTLIRYTMEDAKECLNTIREYESNRKSILDLVGNVTRDDLLD